MSKIALIELSISFNFFVQLHSIQIRHDIIQYYHIIKIRFKLLQRSNRLSGILFDIKTGVFENNAQ